jgi:Flp pilus assembly protein TadD
MNPQWSKPRLPQGLPGVAHNPLDSLHLNAYVAYAVGDYAAAAQLLDKLVQSQPNESAYHFDLGLVRFKTGQYPQAGAAFLQAGKLNNAFADAFYNAGVMETLSGNTQAAHQHFQAARTSDAFLGLRRFGDSFGGLLGKRPAPLERYGWRIPTKDLPSVLDVIAFGLMERGKHEEAAACIRRAMTLELTAKRHVALGTILDKMGRREEAGRQFDTALRMDPRAGAARSY